MSKLTRQQRMASPPTTRRKLPTALLRQHRRKEDTGSRLNTDLPALLWNNPNPRAIQGAESELLSGKGNTVDNEDESPLPVRKDHEGPTDANDVVNPNPKLPLVEEEASVNRIQKDTRKTRKERNDLCGRKTIQTNPDSSS